VARVTGGASGIGRATVHRLVEEGATVLAADLSAEGLAETAATLAGLYATGPADEPGPQSWETTNLLHIGQALTLAAALREETRGGHVRSDHTELVDPGWRGHTVLSRTADGRIATTFEPVPEQDLT
jgi:L-aspartate oxidase